MGVVESCPSHPWSLDVIDALASISALVKANGTIQKEQLRKILLIVADSIKALPLAVCLAIGELILIWLQAVLNEEFLSHWVAMPFFWPAYQLLPLMKLDYVPALFVVVLVFFALLLNSMCLLMILKGLGRWLIARVGWVKPIKKAEPR